MRRYNRWSDCEVLKWANMYVSKTKCTLMYIESMIGVSHSTLWWCFTHRLPNIDYNIYEQVMNRIYYNIHSQKEIETSKLKIAKRVIKEHIDDALCGIFDSRNLVGDPMVTVYFEDNLMIDICYQYEYFEVFGLTGKEFAELEKYYYKLKRGERK